MRGSGAKGGTRRSQSAGVDWFDTLTPVDPVFDRVLPLPPR